MNEHKTNMNNRKKQTNINRELQNNNKNGWMEHLNTKLSVFQTKTNMNKRNN